MSKLKVLRAEQNLTQKELAERANMQECEISHIEHGLQPTKRQLEKLSKALGLAEQKNKE